MKMILLLQLINHPVPSFIPERWNKSNLSLFEYLNNFYCSCKHFFIVHKIDRDCSGLVIFAKTKDAHSFLCNLFEHRKIHKEYFALVEGEVKKNNKYNKLAYCSKKKRTNTFHN